jgi:apolipoprotein N-acyltransferase
MGQYTVGVSWVYVSMHDIGGMPAPVAALATLLLAAYMAAYTALAGWLQWRLRGSRTWLRAWLVMPSSWAFAELARGWVLSGFPWLSLGYSQTDGPLAGIAPLLGVYGVGAAVVSLGAGGALALWHARQRRWTGALAHAGAVVLCTAAASAAHTIAWSGPTGQPLRVLLLQGNVPQSLKFVPGQYEKTVADYTRLIQSARADLVVLPETALPRMVRGELLSEPALATWHDLGQQAGNALIVGIPRQGTEGQYFNAAVGLGHLYGQAYAKSHLVPFGEMIPWGARWFVDLMRMPLADFARGGAGQALFRVGDQRIAANICYEDLFGEEIISALPQATLLLNLSNVAWFGDSLAPHQHLQIARMRSLETARPGLRATNTGATALIGADGRVEGVLPFFTEGALSVTVQGRSGITPYVHLGNWGILVLALAGLLVGGLTLRLTEQRQPQEVVH